MTANVRCGPGPLPKAGWRAPRAFSTPSLPVGGSLCSSFEARAQGPQRAELTR
jgi:hypothetical protein